MKTEVRVEDRPQAQSGGWSLLRPVDYSRPGTYRRPPDSYLRLQWLGPALIRRGIGPPDVVVLEVPGRRSGVIRSNTLVLAASAGQRYLVALAGESEWVRNVRAAGGKAVLGRRQRRAVRLTEIPETDRPEVIRAYVLRWGRRPGSPAVAKEARYFFGVDAHLSEDQLRGVAHRHPVFRVEPVGSLLASFLPRSDVGILDTVVLPAPPALGYRAVLATDFYRVPLIRGLLELRALPSRVASYRGGGRERGALQASPSFRLPDLTDAGWKVLGELADEEFVLGQITRPWEAAWTSTVELTGPEEFPTFDRPGYAKIAFSVRVDPYGAGSCLLTVQTRVAMTDDTSRRRFRRYWAVIGPFSALIRRLALRRVRGDLASPRRGAAPGEQSLVDR